MNEEMADLESRANRDAMEMLAEAASGAQGLVHGSEEHRGVQRVCGEFFEPQERQTYAILKTRRTCELTNT